MYSLDKELDELAAAWKAEDAESERKSAERWQSACLALGERLTDVLGENLIGALAPTYIYDEMYERGAVASFSAVNHRLELWWDDAKWWLNVDGDEASWLTGHDDDLRPMLLKVLVTLRDYADSWPVPKPPTPEPTRDRQVFLEMMTSEVDRARRKHSTPLNSIHEAYAVILEEVDELWDEVRAQHRSHSAVLSELVQIAAMALRTAEDLKLWSKIQVRSDQ